MRVSLNITLVWFKFLQNRKLVELMWENIYYFETVMLRFKPILKVNPILKHVAISNKTHFQIYARICNNWRTSWFQLYGGNLIKRNYCHLFHSDISISKKERSQQRHKLFCFNWVTTLLPTLEKITNCRNCIFDIIQNYSFEDRTRIEISNDVLNIIVEHC